MSWRTSKVTICDLRTGLDPTAFDLANCDLNGQLAGELKRARPNLKSQLVTSSLRRLKVAICDLKTLFYPSNSQILPLNCPKKSPFATPKTLLLLLTSQSATLHSPPIFPNLFAHLTDTVNPPRPRLSLFTLPPLL